MNVRRLAAIDMWGTRGTLRRRRIILAEFVLGAVVAIGLGLWLAVRPDSAGNTAFGAYMLGVGLNYVPLAAYAIGLSRPGALDSELAGVDTSTELKRYGVLQFWLFVPLLLLVFDALNRGAGRPARS